MSLATPLSRAPIDPTTTGRVTLRRSRTRRGFSMLELAISVGLFMFLATTVTMLVTSASSNQSAATRTAAVTQSVTAELQSIASEPYANVASATITVPNPCGVGSNQSCVTVKGVTYTISYTVCPSQPTAPCTSATGVVTSPSSVAGLPSAYTDVTATVTGTPIAPITQRVLAPFNTFATASTGVLVSVDMPTPLTGHNAPAASAGAYSVYLLDASNAQVAASTIGTGTVFFSVPGASCLASSPCHLGLSTGSGYDVSPDGAYALSASSALAPIVATAGSVVSVPAGVFAVQAPTTIALEAQNTGAAVAPPASAIDSVCIWGTFFDGTRRRIEPFCNNATAGQISLATYAPNAAKPGVRFAINPSTAITLSVDNPSGTCPNIGAMVFTRAATWAPGAECTSWTWGVPDGFGPVGSLTPTFAGGVDTTPGINHTTGVVTSLVHNNGAADEMLWSSLAATSSDPANVPGSPASSFAGAPPWSKPRATPNLGCSADATCGSIVGEVAPEATLCPLLNCLSTALFQPYLIAPAGNVTTMQNGAASFPLTVGDLDTAAPITTTLTKLPASGTLKLAGNAVSLGQVFGTALSGTSYALSYLSNTPSSAPSDSFTVTLSNGQPGSAVTEVVYISNGQVVTTVTATPSPVSLAQATSTSVTLHAADANGTAVPGAVLQLNSSVLTTYDRYFASALTVPATVTTNASGDATFQVSASATAAADSLDPQCPCYGFTVTTVLNSTVARIPVTITPAATSVIVSPDQFATTTSPVVAAQGGSLNVYGSVRDLTGGVVDTTPVTFAVTCTATGYTTCPYAGLVSLSPTSCTPASITSNCAATLTVAATAPASVNGVVYTLTASSGVYGLSSSTTLHVNPTLYSETFLSAKTISAGASGVITVQLLDGAGSPMAGRNVMLTSTRSDLTFTVDPVLTDATGTATFNAVAAGSSPNETSTLTAYASVVSATYPTYAPDLTATATVRITGSASANNSAPTVTSVSPSSGPGQGGNTTTVTITGTDLLAASAVDFGATPVTTYTVISSTSIAVPVGATPNDPLGGTVDVTVTTKKGTSAINTGDQYTYIAAPTIASITPTTGPDAGATSVSITGTNFTGATSVTFGGVPATTYSVNSASSITVMSPQHAAGVLDITVTTPGGPTLLVAGDQYTYVAQALTITASSATLVYGTPFTQGQTDATLLAGDAVSVSYTYTGTNSTTYGPTYFTPTDVGTYSVTPSAALFNPGIASNYAITYVAGTVTITPAPLALTFGPAPAGVVQGEPAGTHSVTVTANPAGVGAIVFSSTTPSVCTVDSSTGALTALAAGTCTIDANDSGTTDYAAATQVTQSFTVYPPAPSVTAISPTSGPVTGNTTVTITGVSFTGATGVYFGATAATSYTVVSDTSITVASPPVSATGVLDVTVVNSGSTSPTNPSDQFTYLAAAPNAPAAPVATVASGTSVSVTWNAPVANGALVTGYTVTSAPGGLSCATLGALTCTVTGLTTGTSYTFSVTATNSAGTSLASAPSNAVTPATVPAAPTNVVATASTGAATVGWTAPGDGGTAITGYTVTSSTGGFTCTTTGSTSCTVTGLTVGTSYTFSVTATNAIGTGPASAPSNSVTP